MMWLPLAASCGFEEPDVVPGPGAGSGTGEEVPVRFSLRMYDAMTRSSVAPDEDEVENMNIYAYRDGVLAAQIYAEDFSEMTMKLVEGQEYDIYAFANVGRKEASLYEDDFRRQCCHRIGGLDGLSGAVPMTWSLKGLRATGTGTDVEICLERSVARIQLSLDKTALEGLKVTSVRLCQSPSVLHPFKDYGGGGSRAESVDEVIDGDYATSEDLAGLNEGGQMKLYTLENCQGILLPENTFPSQKVPDMIDGKEGLCTYLEVACEFEGEVLLEGNVVYRIYLGSDACSSFDVAGNSCIDIRLMLTDDGLKEVSWRVDADVAVRDGYAWGAVAEGMHGIDALYVGERLLYEVEVSEQLLEYLGGSAEGCTLCLMSDGNIISGISASELEGDADLYRAELLCDAVSSGSLHLFSEEGEHLGCLENNVNVRRPRIIAAEFASWTSSEPVEGLTFVPQCVVNTSSETFYLYLTDDAGYALNGPRAYGFEKGLFAFEYAGTWIGSGRIPAISALLSPLGDVQYGPAASLTFSCDNPGTDHSVNMLLSNLYAGTSGAVLRITEKNHSIAAQVRVGIDIPQLTLTLVDNGWADYHDCQVSMVVDNPSNLPLEISVWQLNSVNADTAAADAEYVESNLTVNRMDVITGDFWDGASGLYMSGDSFVSERNDSGADAVTDGNELVYPLASIEVDDIYAAMLYDGFGHSQMVHLVDVTLAGHPLGSSDVSLQDKLSDGSARYNTIYGSSGWNDAGVWLYSADRLLAAGGGWMNDYPNVTPKKLERLEARYLDSGPVSICFDYGGQLVVNTYVGMGDQYGLDVTMRYSGTAKGYVRTYPDGTWRGSHDNYCSVDYEHTIFSTPLTAVICEADGGEFKAVLDAVYAYSYKDSDRPLGADSYMHHAHPYAMECKVECLVEGEEGLELYPVKISWLSETLYYYHEQEGKNYSFPLTPKTSPYKFTIVRHK